MRVSFLFIDSDISTCTCSSLLGHNSLQETIERRHDALLGHHDLLRPKRVPTRRGVDLSIHEGHTKHRVLSIRVAFSCVPFILFQGTDERGGDSDLLKYPAFACTRCLKCADGRLGNYYMASSHKQWDYDDAVAWRRESVCVGAPDQHADSWMISCLMYLFYADYADGGASDRPFDVDAVDGDDDVQE